MKELSTRNPQPGTRRDQNPINCEHHGKTREKHGGNHGKIGKARQEERPGLDDVVHLSGLEEAHGDELLGALGDAAEARGCAGPQGADEGGAKGLGEGGGEGEEAVEDGAGLGVFFEKWALEEAEDLVGG